MMERFAIAALALCLLAPAGVFAQTKTKPGAKGTNKAAAKPKAAANPETGRNPQQKFAVNVVRMAVALPQADPQDRLRVLHSAIRVIAPVAPRMAKGFAAEAARIEGQLVSSGQEPAVSVMSSGVVDCKTAAAFVEQLPVTALAAAEQSLIGAVTSCPKQTLEIARMKLEGAMAQRIVPARATMALIDQTGPKTVWSQQTFEKLFSSLPADQAVARREAPNFAAMYVQMAPQVEKAVARRTGLEMLEWAGKLPESGERNLSVNMTVGAMREVLGEKEYESALASNVMARQAAQAAGQPGEVEQKSYESASVLAAMKNSGSDQSERLQQMPASLRAREAAAHGFASGSSGDRDKAGRYFDIAFSALDEVWSGRNTQEDAPAVVEEVSEAAAQVDAVSALTRAQRLHDPTAQAIGMLAVARVVLGQQQT